MQRAAASAALLVAATRQQRQQLLLAAAAAAATAAATSRGLSSAAAPPSVVEVERHGASATVALNRPKALNALSTEVMHAFVDAVLALDADPGVRAIVVTGRGRAFAAGADIREMAGLEGAGGAARAGLFARWQELATGRARWTPLVGAVNGLALGGGAELAMLCDVLVASSDAVFGLPEPSLGVIPGIGGTQRLPRRAGRALALDAMLTGRRLTAAEALAAGLVSRVVPPEQLLTEARAIANKIASLPASAVARVLQAAHAADELPLSRGLEVERRLFYGCFGTAAQREGMRAFLEKRPPAFDLQKGPGCAAGPEEACC